MSSSVSYANIAAQAASTTGEVESKSSPVASAGSIVSNPAASANESAASDSVSVPAPSSEPSESSATAESTKVNGTTEESSEDATTSGTSNGSAKKEKKSLAPAPVPVKSAWGSLASTPVVSSTSSSAVDESKWPTPDKAPNAIENQPGAKGTQQKFIKPITNKWVPISAKVILPSPRNSNQKQNRNRKNKNPSSSGKATSGNQSSSASNQSNPAQAPKKQNQQPINKKDDTDSESAPAVPNASIDSSDANAPVSDDSNINNANAFQNGTNQYPSNFNPQYQKFNGGISQQQQQKNFRRFANNQNANSNGHYKQRFNQNQQQPALPQVPGQQASPILQQQNQDAPQNGFFHPQPFVQNPNFQNFNNRQFRPQNGQQFRPQNRNFRPNNGYRNGGLIPPQHLGPQLIPGHHIPQHQAQIPPPISPKQDPQQALTQQIDYYFSLENLIRDLYLRENMNQQGWVPLSLILNFKRVKIIINGIQNSIESDKEANSNLIVLDSVKSCENLDIEYLNEKDAETATIDDVNLRVKDNFEQWLLPTQAYSN